MLQTASDVSASYNALVELFECTGNFLKRLRIYTDLPLSPSMTETIVKILVELLSVLALATKQTKQGKFSKRVVIFEGEISTCHREIYKGAARRERVRGRSTEMGPSHPGGRLDYYGPDPRSGSRPHE